MTKLKLIEKDKAPEIFKSKDAVEDLIEKLRAEVTSVVPDLSTSKGRKEIASLAYKVAKSKTALDEIGKDLVSDAKAKIKLVDDNRKIIRDKLDALKAEVRKPLTDWENAESERVAKHEQGISDIRSYAQKTPENLSNECVVSRILISYLEELEGIAMGDHWEDFAAEAAAAKDASVAILKQRIADAEKREFERAELDKLRKQAAEREEAERRAKAEREQKEREELLQREAEERARAEEQRKAQEAEKARKAEEERKQREHQAELDRAEREKAEAERQAAEAKLQAERAAEEERQRIARQLEQQRQEEDRRAADKDHRRQINNAAVADFVAQGMSEDGAKGIVIAIAKGLIKNVKIEY